MADISAEIAAFQNAVYGEDVRSALVNLARKINTESSSAKEITNTMFTTRSTLTSTDDLDTLTIPGSYKVNTSNAPINYPTGLNTGGHVLVFSGPTFITQLVILENDFRYRFKTSTSWTNWNGVMSLNRSLNASHDLNLLTNVSDSGSYLVSASSLPANVPENIGGILSVKKIASSISVQLYYINANPPKIYYRTASASSWREWSLIYPFNVENTIKYTRLISQSENIDDLLTTGYYYAPPAVSANNESIPTNSHGFLTVYAYNNTVLQIYATQSEIYRRVHVNTWGSWLSDIHATVNIDRTKDLDDYNTSQYNGWYSWISGSIPSHAPNGYGGMLFVTTLGAGSTSNYVLQMAIHTTNYNDGIFDVNIPLMEIRYFVSGNWSNWLEIGGPTSFVSRTTLTSSNDLNTVLASGVYRVVRNNIPINAPTDEGGLYLVYMGPNNQVVQQFIGVSTSYYRIRGALANWYDWVNTTPKTDNNISNLPILSFIGDISAMTKETSVDLSYTIFNKNGTASVKWQGSSSVRYPKKNFTIKFDESFDAYNLWATAVNTLRANNGNVSRLPTTSRWGNRNKFCTKANWIDPSHSRNIVCARLWGQIVKDRIDRNEIDDGRINAPNYGAIDGMPIGIIINGNQQGLYTLNIPKDKWMFSMGDSLTEYLVTSESSSASACKFQTLALMDGTDFDLEYCDDTVDPNVVLTSFNTLIQSVIDSPDNSSWEEYVSPYMDINSAIDYYILSCIINHYDGMPHNIIYGTYDGVKWFFSAYDMDTTFGSNPYGSNYYKVVNDRCTFYNGRNTHLLMKRIYDNSKTKLKNRYDVLRNGILSEENIWYEFTNFMTEISDFNKNVDQSIWPNMPGPSMAKIDTYMNYYRMHIKHLDSEINNL